MDLNLSCELKRNQEKLVFLQQKEQKREGKKGGSQSSDPEHWDVQWQKLTVLTKQDTKDTWQG